MEQILNMMIEMVALQNKILGKIEYSLEHKPTIIIDKDKKVFADQLELVEKNYLMLDTIIKKMYTILTVSRKQKDKLHNYATNIRMRLNKNCPIQSANKFITVLESHFLNDSEFGYTAQNHKEMYDAVQYYHKINHADAHLNKYKLYKTVSLHNNFSVDISMVDKLSDIPPMFSWFAGDKKNAAGVYICLTEGVYIQVPFPNLISKNSKNFKHKSIPCKYKTAVHCREKQEEYSRAYNTELRQCNFVHIGESFIKIGSDFRCPNLPSFGAYETLEEDLMLVSLADIKNILFNSSSDLLLILLWRKHHQNLGDITFTNLDKLLM